MAVKFEFREPRLKVWLLCHQCHNLVSKCEDAMSHDEEITPEQHGVLMAIQCANDPVTPTDVARWVDRRTHTISLIIERMQKSGLVKRIRDLPDRRSVRLVTTEKGERILNEATAKGWKLICEILSDFSEDELQTLAGLMGKVRDKAFNYLQPGTTMEEIKVSEEQNMVRFLSKIPM
jgi:DNA-binding MarR family transcriptional regulator